MRCRKERLRLLPDMFDTVPVVDLVLIELCVEPETRFTETVFRVLIVRLSQLQAKQEDKLLPMMQLVTLRG